MINIYNESVFSLNKFKRPKTHEDKEAIYTLLTRLLLLEPGTIQSHPEMGIGIVSRYRYSFEGSARDLKKDIDNQIEKYLPEFQGVDVEVSDSNNRITIKITIEDTLYDFSFDSEKGEFVSLAKL